jgi:hypothetical protein
MADDTVDLGDINIKRNNCIADLLMAKNDQIKKEDDKYKGLLKAAASIRSCARHRIEGDESLLNLTNIGAHYAKQVPSCFLLFG